MEQDGTEAGGGGASAMENQKTSNEADERLRILERNGRFSFYRWLLAKLQDPARAKGLLVAIGLVLTGVYVGAHWLLNVNKETVCLRTLHPVVSETSKEFRCSRAAGAIRQSKGLYLQADVDKNRLKRYFNQEQVDLVDVRINQYLDRERPAALAQRISTFKNVANYALAIMPEYGARAANMSLGLPPGLAAFQSSDLPESDRQLAIQRQDLADVIDWLAFTACRGGTRVDGKDYPGKLLACDAPKGETVASLAARATTLVELGTDFEPNTPAGAGDNFSKTCVDGVGATVKANMGDLLVQNIYQIVRLACDEDAVWQLALEHTANLYSDVSFQWIWVEDTYWIFELIYWSMIGVIVQAISTVSAASRPSETTPGFTAYSPQELMQTFSRLYTAPVVAIVVTGLVAAGLTGMQISLANAPALLTFAFISGFASERFIALVKNAVKKLLPRLEVQTEKLDNMSRFLRPEIDESHLADNLTDLEKKVTDYAKSVASNDIVARGAGMTREVK